jgi:hypothetical protein
MKNPLIERLFDPDRSIFEFAVTVMTDNGRRVVRGNETDIPEDVRRAVAACHKMNEREM